MPRTPARVTQADIARALRAARDAAPGWGVSIRPDGTITIGPVDSPVGLVAAPPPPVASKPKIVL